MDRPSKADAAVLDGLKIEHLAGRGEEGAGMILTSNHHPANPDTATGSSTQKEFRSPPDRLIITFRLACEDSTPSRHNE